MSILAGRLPAGALFGILDCRSKKKGEPVGLALGAWIGGATSAPGVQLASRPRPSGSSRTSKVQVTWVTTL